MHCPGPLPKLHNPISRIKITTEPWGTRGVLTKQPKAINQTTYVFISERQKSLVNLGERRKPMGLLGYFNPLGGDSDETIDIEGPGVYQEIILGLSVVLDKS